MTECPMTLEQAQTMHRIAEARRAALGQLPAMTTEERFRWLEKRIDDLESVAAPPLEWPKLDPIPSTTAADRLGMEPFEYCERS